MEIRIISISDISNMFWLVYDRLEKVSEHRHNYLENPISKTILKILDNSFKR